MHVEEYFLLTLFGKLKFAEVLFERCIYRADSIKKAIKLNY